MLQSVKIHYRGHQFASTTAFLLGSVIFRDEYDVRLMPWPIRRVYWLLDYGVQIVYAPIGWTGEWRIDLVNITRKDVADVPTFTVHDKALDVIVEDMGPTYRVLDLNDVGQRLLSGIYNLQEVADILRRTELFLEAFLHRGAPWPPPPIVPLFSPIHRYPYIAPRKSGKINIPQSIRVPINGFDHSFWVLFHPAQEEHNRAVIFLHGLGENRAGLNYIFSEIAERLQSENIATFRFDLAGCGESTLPLDLNLWYAQISAIRELAADYSRIAVICRGAGTYAIANLWTNGPVVAIAPSQRAPFEAILPHIRQTFKTGDVTPQQGTLSTAEEQFWCNLGVEVASIGGLSVPLSFLEQLDGAVGRYNPDWFYIFPENTPRTLPGCILVPDADPLFATQRDREILATVVSRILEAEL